MGILSQVHRMRRFEGTITDWYMHWQAVVPPIRVELHPTTEAYRAGMHRGTVHAVLVHRRLIQVRLNHNGQTMHVKPDQIGLVD